jgi:hypothetical protein
MEMASFSLKIRHVFGFTWLTERSIGAGPPVIIQLSVFDAIVMLLVLHVIQIMECTLKHCMSKHCILKQIIWIFF